jgi:hypothetical protein
VIDPVMNILAEGESINLAKLLADLTQFVKADDLAQESVLFTNTRNVSRRPA